MSSETEQNKIDPNRMHEQVYNFVPAEAKHLAEAYWKGRLNTVVRLWIYLKSGLNQANDFKYLIAGIIALFLFVRKYSLFGFTFDNMYILAGLGLLSVPPLILLGRWQMFRVQKIGEFVSTQYTSIFGYSGWNMQVRNTALAEEQVKLLKKIDEKLDRLIENKNAV